MSNNSDLKPKYPGIPVTVNGNFLVAKCVETRITEGGIFYPITPSTEGGELYQEAFAMGELDVWGNSKIAIECEGEHAAQGGATAFARWAPQSVTPSVVMQARSKMRPDKAQPPHVAVVSEMLRALPSCDCCFLHLGA